MLDHLGDGQLVVGQLLAAVVGDGAYEARGLADEPLLERCRVIHRQRRRRDLCRRLERSRRHQSLEGLADLLAEIIEGIGDNRTRLAQRGVLGIGGFQRTPGLRPRMAKLHAGGEDLRAGAGNPDHQWFGDATLLERLHDRILLHPAQFAKADQQLDRRVGLVAQEVIQQPRSRVSVAADGDPLIDTIGVAGDDVEGLVGQAATLAHVANTAGAIEFGIDDIIRRAARVADFEGACRQTADGRRADDNLAQRPRASR